MPEKVFSFYDRSGQKRISLRLFPLFVWDPSLYFPYRKANDSDAASRDKGWRMQHLRTDKAIPASAVKILFIDKFQVVNRSVLIPMSYTNACFAVCAGPTNQSAAEACLLWSNHHRKILRLQWEISRGRYSWGLPLSDLQYALNQQIDPNDPMAYFVSRSLTS